MLWRVLYYIITYHKLDRLGKNRKVSGSVSITQHSLISNLIFLNCQIFMACTHPGFHEREFGRDSYIGTIQKRFYCEVRSYCVIPNTFHTVFAIHLVDNMFYMPVGANVNRATANNDHTVVSLACAGGHLAVVELLLAHGADPTHRLKVSSSSISTATYS